MLMGAACHSGEDRTQFEVAAADASRRDGDAAIFASGDADEGAADGGLDPALNSSSDSGTAALDAAVDAQTADAQQMPADAAADATVVDAQPADAQQMPADGAADAIADAQLADAASFTAIALASADRIIDPSYLCGQPSLTGPVLLDVGHETAVTNLSIDGDRAITQDLQSRSRPGDSSHWVLWDLTTRRAIANGDIGPSNYTDYDGVHPPAELVGTRLLIPNFYGTGAELRDSRDGMLIATLPNENTHLSVDGSYVWSATAVNVRAWSNLGELLWDKPLAVNGRVFGAVGELRILTANNVLSVSLSDGRVRSSPTVSGTPVNWFVDGERFFVYTDDHAIRIYSAAGVLEQDSRPVASPYALTGYGDWYYVPDEPGAGSFGLTLYRVGSDESVHIEPDDSGYRTTSFSGSTLAVMTRVGFSSPPHYGAFELDLYDLGRGRELSAAHYTKRAGPNQAAASDRNGNWLLFSDSLFFGATQGADLAPHRLGCASITSIVGSDAGRVAISFNDGDTLLFDMLPTQQLLGVIPDSGDGVQLASDGRVLEPSRSVFAQFPQAALVTVPGGVSTELLGRYAEPPYSTSGAAVQLVGLQLDRHAERVTKRSCNLTMAAAFGLQAQTCRADVTDFADHTIFRADYPLPTSESYGTRPVAISPSGHRFGVSDGDIYDEGVLSGSAYGTPSEWLDEDHLLTTTGVYDVLGNQTSAVGGDRAIGTNRVLAFKPNTIRNIADGAIVWQGTPGAAGNYEYFGNPLEDVVGPQIVYLEGTPGTRVLVQTY